ncbi:MAG TPA: hypothetical protein VGN23_15370 [Verrucomicrobiae bacterium]|jgi:hypothetical protein
MLWERDYMRRRHSENADADAAETIHVRASAPEPTDIFAGVQMHDLHAQTPSPKASDDSKTDNSGRSLSSPAPQSELPVNWLLAKHPRFFWYIAIAILGIIIGFLLASFH